MRISTLAILLCVILAHGTASTLAQRVTLKKEQVTLDQLFKAIRAQTGYHVLWASDQIDPGQLVRAGFKDTPLQEVIARSLPSETYSYVIDESTILIRKKEKQEPGTSRLLDDGEQVARMAQVNELHGRVTDSLGRPLMSASVSVKGYQLSTQTDAQGRFSLSKVPSGTRLVISHVGYETMEMVASPDTEIRVVLREFTSRLDDIVVVGYGAVHRRDLTGAVGQVRMQDMAKAPVGSFAEALAGRVAGVQVTASDGQPGGGINVIIRGAGSLTQSTAPLYVIDGFPMEDPDPTTLNPEEIESITVLKDASSAAIYGSRAANGVVLIQTKRGRAGKPVVDYSASVGYQMTPRRMELMSPYEFVKYQLELNPTTTSTNAYLSNGKTLDDYKNDKAVDLQDNALRTGQVQIHNLALRGGSDETRYAISGSYYDQRGVIINTGLRRYSGRMTVDQKVSDRIQAGVTANYSSVNQFGQVVNQGAINSANPTNFVLARIWMFRPVSQPISDLDLTDDVVDDNVISPADYRVNPVIDMENQHQLRLTNLLEANGYISYDISSKFSFKTAAGIRHNRLSFENFFNSRTAQGDPRNISNLNGINGSVRNINQSSFTNANSLTYKNTFGDGHAINGLGLFEINTYRMATNGYGSRLLPNETLGIDGLDEGILYNPVSGASENAMVSFATRWDYNYRSKYVVTFTFRADGSSKFINRWGYFPGAAFAWNMQNESFFANTFPAVSTSKLRMSYGSTGNNRVGDFDIYPRMIQVTDGYSLNNQPPVGAVHVSSIGNPDLKWEKVNVLDIGYEIGLFRNRVSLEADLYRRTTDDLLLNATLPQSSGFQSAMKNIGKLKNEGLELSLNTVNITTPSFRWESSFNISFNRNTIVELTRGQRALATRVSFASGFNRPLYLSAIGKPAGMVIGYIWEGNYQYEDFDNPSPGVYILKPSVPTNGALRSTIQPGDIKYKDLNGDGVMNDADVTYIGRGQPVHIGGFANNFNYKGISLHLFFQWSYGNDVFNANRLLLEGNSNGFGYTNQFASYVDRWSPTNQTNRNYRTRGQGPIGDFSSRVVENGSFVRLKTFSVGYSLPKRLIKDAYLKDLHVRVSAQNLLTWTSYSGLDPEVSTQNNVLSPGYDFSSYPQARTVVIGLNATF